jgi:hypothetical protein
MTVLVASGEISRYLCYGRSIFKFLKSLRDYKVKKLETISGSYRKND